MLFFSKYACSHFYSVSADVLGHLSDLLQFVFVRSRASFNMRRARALTILDF